MSKNLYLKDFPEELHRALKAEAAMQGTTIQKLAARYIEEGLKRDQKAKKKGG